jgi:hypothetical protein
MTERIHAPTRFKTAPCGHEDDGPLAAVRSFDHRRTLNPFSSDEIYEWLLHFLSESSVDALTTSPRHRQHERPTE